MPRRKLPYMAHEHTLPKQVDGSDLWKGHFGEAVIKRGIIAPGFRSLQADIWWLLDNVLKEGECMDLSRGYDQIRMQVARYIRERGAKGALKVRPLPQGKTRVWKLHAGYEKPDT